MLFNSVAFLIFFPLVTALFFALPHRFRWFLLLAASCWFYMYFKPIYILILGFTIVVDYYAGLLIEGSSGRRRKLWLVTSLAANIGVLATFKYWNFLAGNMNGLGEFLRWNYSVPLLEILLPIGLSFHTFQAMSYTIEVYRGAQKAERHFGIYSLYVMFYPQLVAGPIERPQNLLPQFHEEKFFDADRVFSGLGRMLWGMFKKVVIADRVALLVNQVYNNPEAYAAEPGLAYAWATFFFAIQIYCDFSGYSDIAIGSARVMGFKLMENFDRPYLSQSIGEFWRRWHISLSTWFKDYVYVPLGGSRAGRAKWCRNLLVVFLLSGLWHGASWNFVIWGALHGFYLVFGVLTRDLRERFVSAAGLDKIPLLLPVFRTAFTFGLVTFAWIFFRATSTAEAFLIVERTFSGVWYVATNLGEAARENRLGLPPWWSTDLLYALLLSGSLLLVHRLQGSRSITEVLSSKPAWARWGCYYAMLLMIAALGVYGEQSFIYFQF
jgi:D-alanyl-lipoteichoic acid acyltransferase DltB (MBOAT superfamily)